MNDYSLDPIPSKRRKIHAGFLVGMIAAMIMVAVQLFFLLIFLNTNNGDLIALGIQLVVYFLASQIAAQRHYDGNVSTNNIEPLAGVRAAGIGAAITTSLIMWGYIIVRGVVRDAMGITVTVEPFSLFCMIVVDVLLAIALGAWGGTIVVNKYKTKIY